MNIESNATNAASAILSSTEMNSTLSVQNRQNTNSSSSFRDELKSASKTESQDVKEPENQKESEKATENKSAKKADKKSVKEDSKDKKTQTEKTQQSQQGQLNGEISVNAGQDTDAYSMLSEQMKNYVLKNGTQFNLNNNLMTANTRAEISSVQPKVDYTSIQMSDSDAMFFSNLVKNTDMSMQSIAS